MPYVQKSFLWLQRKAMWSKEAALGILSPFHPARGHPFSRSVMSNSLWPHGLQPARTLCPWDFPGKNTGAISFSKGSSPPLNRSHIPHIGWRVLYYWGTWQAQSIPFVSLQNLKKASLLWTLPGFQRLQQWSELEGMLLLVSALTSCGPCEAFTRGICPHSSPKFWSVGLKYSYGSCIILTSTGDGQQMGWE